MFGLGKKKQSNRRPDLLIVGLGNPGAQYDGTPHNVGFATVDEIAQRHRFRLSTFKNHARYTTWEHDGKSVLLVKPMTFMNLSGRAVAHFAKQYAIPPDKILVVADDLDSEFGRVRMKPKGSSGGHNGHKSIAQAIHSEEYPRVKIGIGKRGDAADYVTSKLPPADRAALEKAVSKAATACEVFVEQGLEAAMQACNSD